MENPSSRRRPPPAEPARFLTVGDLVRRWQISPAHAYRIVERGMLTHVRLGKSLRISISSVEAFERQNLVGGGK